MFSAITCYAVKLPIAVDSIWFFPTVSITKLYLMKVSVANQYTRDL